MAIKKYSIYFAILATLCVGEAYAKKRKGTLFGLNTGITHVFGSLSTISGGLRVPVAGLNLELWSHKTVSLRNHLEYQEFKFSGVPLVGESVSKIVSLLVQPTLNMGKVLYIGLGAGLGFNTDASTIGYWGLFGIGFNFGPAFLDFRTQLDLNPSAGVSITTYFFEVIQLGIRF